MFHYNMIQWLAFFYFYCFFGWCFESTYVSIRKRQWVNRGFMRGPLLPLYGSGAIMMLVISMPFQDNILLTFIAGVIGATILEYFTGVCMEAMFQIRYWDYSNQPFNFQGHICLSSSIAWGFLTILMTKVIHKPIETVLLSVPNLVLEIVVYLITIYVTIDMTISFKNALDFRDLLIKMENAKYELKCMEKRLDVLIAVGSDAKEEIIRDLEEKFIQAKESLQERNSEYSNAVRMELVELKQKYNLHKIQSEIGRASCRERVSSPV